MSLLAAKLAAGVLAREVVQLGHKNMTCCRRRNFPVKNGMVAYVHPVELPILATIFLHHGPIQGNTREDAMRARPR